MTRLSLFILAFSLAAAGSARGAEIACRFEAGVPVVPAMMAGLAGDFVLDTGAPRSQLHETKAQAAGIAETALTGDVSLAGVSVAGLSLAVADLDVRGWNLSTPLAGVIGADALRGLVVDVSYAPCRVRISRPGEEPAFHGRALPMAWDNGRPTVEASVSDDAHQITGRFVVATGANAPARLADDLASVAGLADPKELYPDGVWLARLPQVSFAGAVGRDVAVGLMPPQGDVAGVLGGPVLAHFRLRFDFPAGQLVAQPAR
ncbi:MAG: aspartyl protease family protein [Pseudomonadota bacterium]